MNEFYVDVVINRVMTRVQVDEIPEELLDIPTIPQFNIDFYNGKGFTTLTLQLEWGQWYDRNSRLPGDEPHLRYFEPEAELWNPDYQSPLSSEDIQEIGRAIARHMVVKLTSRVGLFVPVFPDPSCN